jgi:hypothetical protein
MLVLVVSIRTTPSLHVDPQMYAQTQERKTPRALHPGAFGLLSGHAETTRLYGRKVGEALTCSLFVYKFLDAL